MGINDVGGALAIVLGAQFTIRAVAMLARPRRSGARSEPGGPWAGLLTGSGFLLIGVLYFIYPRFPHGTRLGWIALALLGAGLILMVVSSAGSFRSPGRVRRLGPISTHTLDLSSLEPSSPDLPGPGPAVTPDARTAALIERIKNVRFSTVRLVPGYDEQEVDCYLDKLVALLSENGQLDRSELHDIHFSRTRIRPGYAMPDVDTFLAEVAQAA
jgi:DivIVA domain-containing protein